MIRSKRTLSLPFVVLIAGLYTHTVFAHDHIDVEYAEQMPLAVKSVLLDITGSGNTLVAVGERGHVILSSDGENWEQADHVPTRSTLTSVFSYGNRLWAGGHDAVIITSGDGGETWTEQFFDPDRQQAVMDIYFKNEKVGVAIGSYGLVLKTEDGGITWVDDKVDLENDYHLNALADFGDGRQLIAGEAGFSYRSYDSGETWEAIDVPYQGSMWGALKTKGDCVLFYGLRGHIMESCDFGTTWTELETHSESSISAAAEHEGLIVLAANSGSLLIRDDSGNFKSHHHSSGVDFSAVLSRGDGRFLLVGEDGVHHYPEINSGGNGND